MLKTWGAVGLLIVAATATAWMMVPTSNAPSTNTIHTEGSTICGTHHCAPGANCCPSCTTGELRCYGGTRCPECAPQ